MATSKEYIEYVCEQMKEWNPSYKKMFGEYVIYINNKPLFTVCDDTVYVKELECIRTIMGDAEKGFPYEGAKECYIVDTDNKELLEKIIPEIGQVISIPIKRNSKKGKKMIQIEYVKNEDKEFWYKLDSHLPESEFENKIRDKQGYVLFVDSKPVGILRYNLFWDNTPFCTLLFIDWNEQKKGYGELLINHWEKDMKQQGYGMVLTSTQVDESAQHFYRKLGYQDCGGIVMNLPGYEQPMEMFLCKAL